jgi:membrane protease YdiL (CAAX protease family)
MFCPQCAADYRAGFTRCSDCDVSLVAERIIFDTKRTDAPSNLTLTFFLFTFALTWGYSALAYVVESPSYLLAPALMLLSLLGSLAPSLVALSLTAREQGIDGATALLRRLLIWRVELRWYLFAIFYMAVITLVAFGGASLITGVSSSTTWSWFAIVWSVLVKAPVVASEEIGWRGFALPRLTERLGLRKASLVLGILWAAWPGGESVDPHHPF